MPCHTIRIWAAVRLCVTATCLCCRAGEKCVLRLLIGEDVPESTTVRTFESVSLSQQGQHDDPGLFVGDSLHSELHSLPGTPVCCATVMPIASLTIPRPSGLEPTSHLSTLGNALRHSCGAVHVLPFPEIFQTNQFWNPISRTCLEKQRNTDLAPEQSGDRQDGLKRSTVSFRA